MDGGFPISLTLGSVAMPSAGLTPDISTEAGFLEALTRNLGEASASPVAPTVTPSAPPDATLPELTWNWAGQAPVALNFAEGIPSLEAPIGTVIVDSKLAEASLIIRPEEGKGLKAGDDTVDPDGTATPPEADVMQTMMEVATVLEGADQGSDLIETTDQAAASGDTNASDVMNWVTKAEHSRSEAQMPMGASGAAPSLPRHVALTPSQNEISPVPQQLVLPLLPPAGIAPPALASALAAQSGVQLQSAKPQDLAPEPGTEAIAEELVARHLSPLPTTPPPQPGGQSLLPEPGFSALAASVSLHAPLRNVLAQPTALQALDTPPMTGVTIELGITSPVNQPSGATGFIARPPEAAATPPMRQLAPIAIALAFTPGAANGFNLTLHPVELGRVEIRVQREADGHSVRIMAERPETLALLLRDRHELDRSLTDAGLRVASDGIDFSLGNSGPGRDAPRQEGERHPARGRGGTDTAELKAELTPARFSRGLLDLNI